MVYKMIWLRKKQFYTVARNTEYKETVVSTVSFFVGNPVFEIQRLRLLSRTYIKNIKINKDIGCGDNIVFKKYQNLEIFMIQF